MQKRKIAIIGVGMVGASTAFSLVTQGVCDEVMLVDINKDRAIGEMTDLRHSIDFLNHNVKITTGNYEDCGDADIIVLTAGPAPRQGENRLDTLPRSAKIIEQIVSPIMKSGFNGHFVVISNPVDIISYFVYKLSRLPKNQVIGTGTSLDSARLKSYIGEQFHIDPRSVNAFVMGEHGDSQVVPWSLVTVGGKSMKNVMEDNPGLAREISFATLEERTTKAGWEIIRSKGATYYGIATACAGIIQAIVYDENRIVPVSTLLEGEYGL
ncbi:MAG: L-lactate dehydrogenase, partial [Oscillospiraceae bacterium]